MTQPSTARLFDGLTARVDFTGVLVRVADSSDRSGYSTGLERSMSAHWLEFVGAMLSLGWCSWCMGWLLSKADHR